MEKIFLGRGKKEVTLLSNMANRHGLIAGATGTGKTASVRIVIEALCALGVPTFVADVKGDLAGLSQPGSGEQKFIDRATTVGLTSYAPKYFPTVFWDVFGKEGHPIRATVSDLGPLLLSRLLGLNDTQAAVLAIIFKIADENGLLLHDLKDLQAVVQHVGDTAKNYTTSYGNISSASIGAIQRGVITLSEQGGEEFFGVPMLDVDDLLRTDGHGQGIINILAATKLMQQPRVYGTMLLWLLSELYERLPEVGDLGKPKFVFFFDEAHLLFNEAPKILLEKIELVVRLIRSKGVGVFFISQIPTDIPDSVLGQLGNRIQHALRAFSARDEKGIKTAADTFRGDGSINIAKALTELGVGEALVSCLDEKGAPSVVEWTLIAPPQSRLGPITQEERDRLIKASPLYGKYEGEKDNESAFEVLRARARQAAQLTDIESAPPPSKGSRAQSPFQAFISSAARAIGSQVGRQIVRGVLGAIIGKSVIKRF